MSEWISIDKELPEEGRRVLITWNDFDMDDLWQEHVYTAKHHNNNWVSENRSIAKPTHWMLPPEPPEVNDE